MYTRFFTLLILFFSLGLSATAQIYGGKKGAVKLTGTAPQETIVATSSTLKGKIDAQSMKFNFQQSLDFFSFSQGAMQKKDAEEKYWETDKFPKASFSGIILNQVDLSKDGVYRVTTKGKFEMHGETKDMKIPATITVRGGQIEVNAKFSIFLTDFNIEIPRLMSMKVAEEFMVELSLSLEKA